MLSNFQLPPSSNESHGHLCTTETWKRTDCTNTLENTHRATISSSFIQFNGFFVQAKLSCSEITFVHRPCPDFIFFFSFRDKVSSANVAHTAGEHSFTVLKRKYRIQYGFKFSTKTERKEEKAKIVTNDRVYCVGGSSRTNDWEAAVAVLLCTFHSPASRDSSLCIFARIYNEAGDQHAGRALRGLPNDEHRSVKSNLASIKQQISK